MPVLTLYLTLTGPLAARGLRLPHPHHHSRYSSHGYTSGLLDQFVNAIARALGWRTGDALFSLLGSWALPAGLAVAGIALALVWRRNHRRRRSTRRPPARRTRKRGTDHEPV